MNSRIKLLHFSAGISCLGSRMTIAADPTPGVPVADYIRRVSAGYMVKFMGKLVFVPDTTVLAAEVEDLDPVPAAQDATPPPAMPAPAKKEVVLSEAEIRARAALEERQKLAAERKRIADEIVAKEKR